MELEVGGGDWSACLSEDEASNFVRGALPRARFHAIEAHLDSCSDCLTYVAALAAAIGSGAAGNDESRESTHRLIDALDDAWFRGTDRFAVVRRLGSGGMGLVYEAFDRERGTRVALKVLPTRRPEALLRFKNEFRSLQDLQHPNLVRMGELFVHEDQWFFTMELVEGIDFLRYVWRKAPIYDQPRLRSALRQLAVGLSTLHASGQVHRDIKPKNILVTPTGRLVILDFGLVHAGEAFEASDLHTVGTVAYMAPEQASSQPIDAAADWYSVGVMLFEALTGHLPFEGAPRDILAAKRERDPPTVESFDPNAPADLASLCNQLLRLRPSDRPTGAEVLWRLGAAVPPSGGQVAPAAPPAAPFVGRTDELTRLRGAFAATSAGRAAVVIIAGESGIGKTALARRFTDLARAQRPDAIVLRGRCYEREAVAYKAFDGVLDALSRFLLQLAHDEAAALLPHGKTSLLARAFPVLGRVDAVAAAPPPEHEVLDPQELRSQVFSALRELFSRLGERHPLVVVIDDLQWSDADSLALLGELMREPDPPALLLLATLRSDDTGARPAIRELPGTLQRLGDKVSTLHLERLPRADAETLARALLNERAAPPAQLDAQQLAEEARGHPLYIDELARHPVGFGLRQPRALRLDEVLWSRVEHLDPASRQVLAAVAIAGGPLPQEAARRATHLPPEDLDRVLTVLRVEHLTRTTGAERSDLVECYHDRVREAVVGHLAAGAEREIHRELALALAETADPEQLAVHWHAAGERQRAANYAIRAAEAAADALAFARAARLYRFALELVDEADPRRYSLFARLGDMLANAGRGREAADAYLAAVTGSGDAAKALDLRRRAAEQLLISGHLDEGMATMRSVLDALHLRFPATPGGALVSMLWHRTRARLRRYRFDWREAHTIAAEDLQRVDICESVSKGLMLTDMIRAADYQARTLVAALEVGEPGRISEALSLDADNLAGVARFPSTRAHVRTMLARATELALQLGDPKLLATCTLSDGVFAFTAGGWSPAAALFDQAIHMFRERCTGVWWQQDLAVILNLWSLQHAGRWAELFERHALWYSEARARGNLHLETLLSTSVGGLQQLAVDDPDGARRQADEAMTRWSHTGYHVQHFQQRILQGEVCLYLGDGMGAHRAFLEAWPALKRSRLLHWPYAQFLARPVRARAALMAAAQTGRRGPLLRRAAADARALRRKRMSWSEPLARTIEAGCAALRGRPDVAMEDLKIAVAGFEHAGMALEAAAARHQLGALGGGDAGEALRASASDYLRRQGIRRPERMVEVFAPGFAR